MPDRKKRPPSPKSGHGNTGHSKILPAGNSLKTQLERARNPAGASSSKTATVNVAALREEHRAIATQFKNLGNALIEAIEKDRDAIEGQSELKEEKYGSQKHKMGDKAADIETGIIEQRVALASRSAAIVATLKANKHMAPKESKLSEHERKVIESWTVG